MKVIGEFLARGFVLSSLVAQLIAVWPSDRWVATGMLAYVPATLHAVGALVALGLLSIRPDRNCRWVAPALLVIVFAVTTLIVDHRASTGAAPNRGTVHRVLQWNIQAHASMSELPELARDTICLSEVVTGGRYKPEASWHQTGTYGMVVISRHPVAIRQSWQRDSMRAIHVVVSSDPPLSVLVVDIDAQPWRSRRLALESLRSILPFVEPAPDVITGDFNTPAGSWSLRTAMGVDYVDAYRVAGTGNPYTWPSVSPLMRIDHVFVRTGVPIVAHLSGLTLGSDHAWQEVTIGR